MKKRIVLLLTYLFVCIAFIDAQNVPQGVVVAFKNGNSQQLNSFLCDKVELIIQNQTTQADKNVASEIINRFFTNNKVKSFEVNHQGNRNESSFFIGTLMTDNGEYRINCFFRKLNNKYIIHQIRIDKTNG